MNSLSSDNSYEFLAVVEVPPLEVGKYLIVWIDLTYFDKEK